MNIYLFQLIINWLGTLCLSIFSLLGVSIKQDSIIINNTSNEKNVPITSTIIKHDTIKKYNNKLPSNKTNIIVEGSDGIIYETEDGETKVLRDKVDEIIEIGTGAYGSFVGKTTGYGADCLGCSGTVSCRTREGTSFNINNDGTYYNDSQYGKVRVVAADHRVLGCGTIIEIDNGMVEPFLAIVLDTGIGMIRSWQYYQLVHIDIAFDTEENPLVYSVTSSSANIEVQRWGW